MGDGTKENPFTREDVRRLIEERGTANGLDLSGKVFQDGIDLRGVNLDGIILRGAVLWNIELEDPEMDDPTAGLEGAHLEGASLCNAHLEGAHILASHLEGAHLFKAHLEAALLTGVHFEGSCLHIAHLEGSKLRGAHLDNSYLAGIKLSSETDLENVGWGDYILGEERERLFDIAAQTYRHLKQWHTNAGMYDKAAKFYYREKEANRKALKLFSKSSWNHRIALQLSYWAFGHGEGWKRLLFGVITSVIILFALGYFLGRGVAHHNLTVDSFMSSLYYSAVSFIALGYGPWFSRDSVEPWARGVGVFESFCGFFLMTLLLVTFVRKWTR